jgi:hypothetical protein
MLPGFASSVPMACDDKLSLPALENDEQPIEYSSSLEHMDLEDNWKDMTDFSEHRP